MASDAFTGTASTQLATHDSNWKACTVNDSITTLVLDGSGHLQQTAINNWCDAYYDNGTTNSNSLSEIVIPAGVSPENTVNNQLLVNCRMTSSQLGYSAHLYSASSNATATSIKLLRNGSFLQNFDELTIDTSAAVTISIQVVNTVDVRCICNGVTYTSTGSGGNDASGNPVLTGGFPGIGIHNNGATNGQLIDSWTDGVAASSGNPYHYYAQQ